MIYSPEFILIGGGVRCGNSVLNFLLDGHDELLVYPFEFKFKHREKCHPWAPKLPYFEKIIYRVNPKLIMQYFDFDSFIGINQSGYIQKAGSKHIKIDFNKKLFNKIFLETIQLSKKQGINNRIIMDALNNAMFKASGCSMKNKRFVVGSWPNSCFINVDQYFNTYNKGFFIHVLRDLKSWVASMKQWMLKNGRKGDFVEEAVKMWLLMLEIAVINSIKHANRYILVYHNNLVTDTKNEMFLLLKLMGLNPDYKCLKPTCLGKSWHGNMSNKKIDVKGKVETKHLKAWEIILNDSEITTCDKIWNFFKEDFSTNNSEIIQKKLVANHKKYFDSIIRTDTYTFGDLYHNKKNKDKLVTSLQLYNYIYGLRLRRRLDLLIDEFIGQILYKKLLIL